MEKEVNPIDQWSNEVRKQLNSKIKELFVACDLTPADLDNIMGIILGNISDVTTGRISVPTTTTIGEGK